MKIVNILFNHKKSAGHRKILGVERCFIDYTKYLILNGHQVVSVAKTDMVYRDDIKKTGSRLLELQGFGKGDILSILRLAILFFTFDADVIICHSGRAMFFARAARFILRKKTPIVAINHGINAQKFLKADYVLSVNSYFSKEIIKAGKSPDRSLVIPNMIEVPDNFIAVDKSAFRNPIRFGSLGRLASGKNFHKIIDAMAILRDKGVESECFIGGIGEEKDNLNEQAKKLGLAESFKILDWVSDKKEFFDSIDIFILPSSWETFGIVLLEAMLYNTPIITTDSWGPDEIIDHEIDGLKITMQDREKMPELLADAILHLKKDQNFARNLAKKANEKFFAKYTAPMVIKKLEGILEVAVKSGI